MTEKKKTGSRYSLQRQSLPDALALSLRERILNGEFKEGDPLIQEAIAAEYECSRMPVREAFRQLEAAGLIVSKIHKGSIVTTLSPDQIMELFELRAMLESDILKHALPKMTEESLDHSERLLALLEEAYHSRDMARFGALNWDYHQSLYLPAGRIQTFNLIRNINIQTDRYIRLQLLLTSAFEDAEREHRSILEMCRARDVKVMNYTRDHILRAGRNLLNALDNRKKVEAAAGCHSA